MCGSSLASRYGDRDFLLHLEAHFNIFRALAQIVSQLVDYRFDGLLLIAIQARETIGEGVGNMEVLRIKSGACTKNSWPFVVLGPSRNALAHYLACQQHPAIQ